MMRSYTLLVFLLVFVFTGKAQKLEYEQGSMLIQLRDDTSLKEIAREFSRFDGQYTGFVWEEW